MKHSTDRHESIDERKKVREILEGFSTAMLISLDSASRPAARPMHIAEIAEDGGEVSFLTGQQGKLAAELQREALVLLTFQKDSSAYLSARGTARVDNNRAKIKALWKEPYKVWFPGGPEDPEIALVRVELVDAEYWDNRGMNKLQYLFKAAKAYVKGEQPDLTDADQHAKVTL